MRQNEQAKASNSPASGGPLRPQKRRLRFGIGQLAATPDAAAAMQAADVKALSLLRRHMAGDWGHMAAEDAEANDASVRDGGTIYSAYILPTGRRIWLITAADRSNSTFMLPEEY